MASSSLTVFLDRDGVINVDSPDYVKSPDEFHFIPGSTEAIAMLHQAGCDIIVVTNQSAVGRGMISHETLQRIFDKMIQGVEADGGKIKDIFFCPHTPDEGCSCRKPAPGLILQAAEKYDIDLYHSVMVGDSVKDIAAARAARCRLAALVLSGKDPGRQHNLAKKTDPPDATGLNLLSVVEWILHRLPRS